VMSTQLDLERTAEVWHTVNAIVDPCSSAMGAPIGLGDMGIVDSVDVTDGHVLVRLLPTSPGCLYTGIFDAEIQRRLRSFDWCTGVEVALGGGDEIWTEERMSAQGRARLEVRRRDVRRRLRAKGAEASKARS
jgi:metal-sulfur cluster biosynthetic enzyme